MVELCEINKNHPMSVIIFGSDNYKSFDVLRMLNARFRVLCFIVDEPQNEAVTSYCERNGIPIHNKVSVEEYGKIDLLVSFSYHKLIDAALIKKAKIAINFHPAPLPFYRGRATTVWALLNGEKKWGVTCHYLTETFDTGKIIERRWFDITDNIRSGYRLSFHCWDVCYQMLEEMLDSLMSGNMPEGQQQEIEGEYYSMKKLVTQKELSLDEPVETIDRKVSALWYPPYEGAYIKIDGKKFYLINEYLMNDISKMYNN